MSLFDTALDVMAVYREGGGVLDAASADADRLVSALERLCYVLSRLPMTHPVSYLKWVPFRKVRANDWNPNKVASVELQLLYVSIKADGFTQPIVTIRDEENDRWIVVDGFHRYRTLAEHPDILESACGLVPVVELQNRSLNDLKASTIRHNRARGKHGVGNMAEVVFEMLEDGWTEERICRELGMSADEIVRLKHVTGFSKLFEDTEYRRAWETKRMAQLRREYVEGHPGETLP